MQKEYTPLRRFYAWYGLVSIILHTGAIIAFLIWAHKLLNSYL